MNEELSMFDEICSRIKELKEREHFSQAHTKETLNQEYGTRFKVGDISKLQQESMNLWHGVDGQENGKPKNVYIRLNESIKRNIKLAVENRENMK
ncbi:MAG: hypothetical protein MR585_00020 [Selenomonas bovis]|nr:hypothetical protein [Selenomonas bovis]